MGIKYRFSSIAILVIIASVIIISFCTRKSEIRREFDDQKANRSSNEEKNSSLSRCDLFSGKWVFDKSSKSLYSGLNCSFMDEVWACEKFGRNNLNYKYWRWQPHHCDLPRFDAILMLEKLRNKRMVFVGDSINKNQWESMVCMVESLIPPSSKYMHFNGSLVMITFKATVYNATIDFYWAPLLVESNCDNSMDQVQDRIVRIHAIEKHAMNWIDADILVFNSYLWWRQPKFKILQGSFESPDGIYEDVDMLRGYEMALKTWSNWLDVHINRTKTKLFFVSISPTHNRADNWGKGVNETCYNETEPILKEGYWGMDSDSRMMRLVETEIQELKTKGLDVQILNITQLSEYRKEGHPSIYKKNWEPLSKEQLSNPNGYADCIHWCLPGIPDVWNVILYSYLLF